MRLNASFLVGTLLAWSPAVSFAAHTIEVTELDGGCWIKQLTNTHWRLDANGSGKVANLDRDSSFENPAWPFSFRNAVTRALRAQGFQNFATAPYEVYLRCFSTGAKIIVDMRDANTPLCIWSEMNGTTLEVENIYTNHSPPPSHTGSPCYGEAPGLLLLTLSSAQDADVVINHLTQSATYREMLTNVSFLPPHFVQLSLSPSYLYREAVGKSALESDLALMSWVLLVDYDRIGFVSGEDYKLTGLGGTFPGF